MAVFKCKLCGGTIEPREGGIGVCDSCGTKQTIPNTNDEKKMNLLGRANHFRMQNEFDKALAIYEQVLEEDTEDSDVYYAIALCRYGITYVDDKKTKTKIPTVNRMQSKMFTKDADFMMAVEKAEPEQAKLYNEDGSYIDKVQAKILDISKNEKPYDVFICYKETDDNGERTYDSVLANDLYYGLTNEGFKVFFARITLEGKLGTAYEPYIFSALNSSKVMVVLGTKKEYFNSVWVKNEWSRFLTFINEGEKKTLIPAYKDMDPYDLPDEFANLQAQDMSKLGFMQDLVRGIKKIIDGTKEIDDTKRIDSGNNSNVNSLLKRVKIFLEDGHFDKADEYCERILDIDAENADAYYYKLLLEMKCRNETELVNIGKDLSKVSENFNNVLKYANDKQKQVIEDINNDGLLRVAQNLMKENKYNESIDIFDRIINYKNSLELKNEGLLNIGQNFIDDGKYNEAIKVFDLLGDYRNSNNLKINCEEKIKEIENDKIIKKVKISKIIYRFLIIGFLITVLPNILAGQFSYWAGLRVVNHSTRGIDCVSIVFLDKYNINNPFFYGFDAFYIIDYAYFAIAFIVCAYSILFLLSFFRKKFFNKFLPQHIFITIMMISTIPSLRDRDCSPTAAAYISCIISVFITLLYSFVYINDKKYKDSIVSFTFKIIIIVVAFIVFIFLTDIYKEILI